MRIESIKNETLETITGKYEIVELKVRGKKEYREEFFNYIQDIFDLASDDWDESLSMLTMTFDKKPKEQTVATIRQQTDSWIRYKGI